MNFTDISILDPIMSIGVAIFILYNALKNLHTVVDLFLEKTPANVNLEEVKKSLLEIKGVLGVHRIHVRSIDGYRNYATLHVEVSKYSFVLKEKIKHTLEHQNIKHSTIELELEGEKCSGEKCVPVAHRQTNSHSHHVS